MKKIMLGNEAVAGDCMRPVYGLFPVIQARPARKYPNLPQNMTKYTQNGAPNEKVALEAAIGASFGGGRAFSGMKHVGLNVAADPLFVTAYYRRGRWPCHRCGR